ncbi:GNAT superfamily N-acetyltransferase [Streptomyces griseochromogenes]|uniref:GCN5 family acetyltransferase n=1 Tax=Streptomyces griseochromogenes TaxID=68214 RepID=A0A1B1AXT6_9ACTN|nr:GNAT family N-acetyltransferase [Streptomyces griseochromogenes]ANP51347.1 GCN5 family acetyltransferase [Streptomyces griseochromogenes]MBP2049945.1 GNAT superfamily N-acetyltransferase [Streptomyces griseochromogenes]
MYTDVQSFAVANLLRRPAAVEIAGFVAGFDPTTTSPYINYATPVPGAEPTDRDVSALIEAFRERGLKPRLEFAPDTAPAVEPALRRAGFDTEAVHEYLVCTPATLAIPAGKTCVEVPDTDEDYVTIDTALSEAFGGEFPPSPQGAARLRRTQESGGAVRFVRADDGGCAGAAICSAPAEGTAELAGVGTRPAYRGRGIAAAVTAALAQASFDCGTLSVWLEYSGEGSRRVYERVGFRPAGTRLYVTLEG